MGRPNRRRMLATLGSAFTIGLAGCGSGTGDGGDGDDGNDGGATATPTGTGTPTEQATGNVRVAHFSPDAPSVDVYVDGERALQDVPFRAVSDYREVPTGARTVQITAAGDRSTVAFEGDIEVAEGEFTVAAVGELTGEDSEFGPLVLRDDNSDPGGDRSRLRAVHVSPDAPTVDIAVGPVLFNNVAFRSAGYATVGANDYTAQVSPETMGNEGDVVYDADVSLTGGSVYTAFASGYLTPDDEPDDEAFELTVVQDASY